ncbi:MAG: ComEC/Rec2 family competence protein [Odoribacteraceae bacterium]|jgi:competence protein ComEC|nr:ComEC/Rec2 family competence protein [Odoribacteraceae bacterium]
MFSRKYPFLLLLLPVIAGIIAREHLPSLTPATCYIIATCALVGIATRAIARPLLPLLACALLFAVSLARSHQPAIAITPGEIYHVNGTCADVIRGNNYIIRSRGYNLYCRVDDTLLKPVVGDRLAFRARLFPVGRSADASGHDPDRYLRQLDVHSRAIPLPGIQRVGSARGIYPACQKARALLARELEQAVKDTTTRALLQALCLGDRSLVSPRVQALFRESGTMHLLAVSGLHVGVIHVMFHFLLGLARLRARARLACILPLLWLFAGITGLSPPTVRAATILSFIIAGKLADRDYNPLNALFASAFVTLLVSPPLLYSASFQMSHAAYAGIILLLPALRVKRENTIRSRVRALLALGVAAQVGTLPLVAYYFHSVNLNSALANIVAVPLATGLLYAGVAILLLPTALATALAFIPVLARRALFLALEQCNRVALPWRDLYPTIWHVLLVYLLALLAIIYLKRRDPLTGKAILVALFLLLLYHATRLHVP